MGDSSTLKEGDVVGLLVSGDGDLTVFVNKQQQVRIKTSLAVEYTPDPSADTSSKPSKEKKVGDWPTLYPIVGLCARVQAVSLMLRCQPPNMVLQPRTHMK